MPLGGKDATAVVQALDAQQALPARRDRAPREPEIRARPPLSHRRALRRGGADRAAVCERPQVRARPRQGATTTNDDSATNSHLPASGQTHAFAAPAGQPAKRPQASRRPAAPVPAREARRPRLARPRQAGRHDLDPGGRRDQAAVQAPRRAGHAGTLDPLASGCLPIALGEATKTVPFVMDGRKAYRFTVRWGEERDTDDAEGARDRDQRRRPPGARGDRGACCRASPARSCRCRRAIPRSRSPASAPMTSPATARRSSSRPRPVEIDRLDPAGRPGRRPCGIRGRMRQGHLCAGARPRHGPGAGLPRPCRGAAPPGGRRRSAGNA